MKGMTNLMLSAIIVKSMDIMLESVERSKETMAIPMPNTLKKVRTRKNLKGMCS